MTEAERDQRTESVLARSRQLREQLSSMLQELEGFVHELDTFITTTPRGRHADRTSD
jgi:hypothetical protein